VDTASQTQELEFFAHLPGVAFDGTIAYLNGQIGQIPFKKFEDIESDWAHESRFTANKPVFWSGQLTAMLGDAIAPVSESAMLFFLALIAHTGRIAPDPRLSMIYLHNAKSGATRRSVGACHRNLILHGNALPPFGAAELVAAAEIATGWSNYGLDSDNAVFRPLVILGSSAFSEPHPIIGLLPLMITLEGLLVGRPVTGVASHMASTIRMFCAADLRDDPTAVLRKAYEYRSRLIHGRRITNVKDASAVFASIRALAGAVIIGMINAAQGAGVPSADLIPYLRGRIEHGR
jgi:hypothetical protein